MVRIMRFVSVWLILCLVFVNSIIFAEEGLVAIVNNEVITQKDLDDFINFMRIQMSAQYSEAEIQQRIEQMLPDLINRLIEDRLILQAAYKENLIIEPIRIRARVEQIKKQYPREADFQNRLAAQGLSLSDIELKIKEELLMFKIIDERIKSKIVVSPQEVTDYYYAHSNDFNAPQKRSVRFLTIRDSSLAQQIQNTITEYEDLDAIAKKYSLEITDLGWVTTKQLKEEIADIVFGLNTGELSPVLDSDDNSYVFVVTAIKPPQNIPLFDIQGEISRLLFEKKMQESLVEWLEELKSEAYIKIKD